jgi:hypothetical protein
VWRLVTLCESAGGGCVKVPVSNGVRLSELLLNCTDVGTDGATQACKFHVRGGQGTQDGGHHRLRSSRIRQLYRIQGKEPHRLLRDALHAVWRVTLLLHAQFLFWTVPLHARMCARGHSISLLLLLRARGQPVRHSRQAWCTHWNVHGNRRREGHNRSFCKEMLLSRTGGDSVLLSIPPMLTGNDVCRG